MHHIFQPLKPISCKNIYQKIIKFELLYKPTKHNSSLHIPNSQNYSFNPNTPFKIFHFLHSLTETAQQHHTDGELAIKVINTLKNYRDSPTKEIELALDLCGGTLTEDLVLGVLKRCRSDWKPAYIFFNWVFKGGQVSLGSSVYNEILDILGKMRRFQELSQVLDKMSKRRGLLDKDTYTVLVHRYTAAHKVEEAIGVFEKRRELGLESDLVAFQMLLFYLCRYKHVRVAETLLYSKGNEFDVDIKSMSIVLNGWCVLGNLDEVKRFWKGIIESKCKPDVFTYGTYIKALSKKGELEAELKLYREMQEEECKPNVVICTCVIDALCAKNRVFEALDVLQEMKEQGCLPDVVTYNSFIKYFCKIQNMEKVYELLDEMEEKKGDCMPDRITFTYLLKSVKKPEEAAEVLERMERNQIKMNGDMYNSILKLYLGWDYGEKVRNTWNEMEKNGLGPDRHSYTIMIHGLYEKGRIEDALHYLGEMRSKGMAPEPRTEILVNAMNGVET